MQIDEEIKKSRLYKKFLRLFADIRSPEGKRDTGHRWHPSENETVSCCKGLRSPEDRLYPSSLYKHCTTVKHINNLIKEGKIAQTYLDSLFNEYIADYLSGMYSERELIDKLYSRAFALFYPHKKETK